MNHLYINCMPCAAFVIFYVHTPTVWYRYINEIKWIITRGIGKGTLWRARMCEHSCRWCAQRIQMSIMLNLPWFHHHCHSYEFITINRDIWMNVRWDAVHFQWCKIQVNMTNFIDTLKTPTLTMYVSFEGWVRWLTGIASSIFVDNLSVFTAISDHYFHDLPIYLSSINYFHKLSIWKLAAIYLHSSSIFCRRRPRSTLYNKYYIQIHLIKIL